LIRALGRPFAGKTLLSNAFATASQHTLNHLFPLILIPYLTRILGPVGWGLVAFTQAFAQLVQVGVEYGFQLSATRELAINRHSRQKCAATLAEVTAAKLLLLSVAVMAAIILSKLIPHLESQPLLLWSAVIWTAGHALNMTWFYQGIERLRPAVVADLVGGVTSTVAVFFLVRHPDDGWKVLLIQGIASLLAAFATFYQAVGYSGLVRPSLSQVFQRIQSGRHTFVYRFALGTYSFGNPFVLGWMAPVSTVAYFAGADKITRATLLLVYPLAQALFPRVNYHAERGDEKAGRLATIGLIVAAVIGIASGIAVVLGAPVLVRLLLGSRFLPSVDVLRALALLCPLIAINTVLVYQWLLPRFLDASLTRLTLTAGVINLCFALLLAPRYGAVGMAWAVVLTEVFVLGGCCFSLMRAHRAPTE